MIYLANFLGSVLGITVYRAFRAATAHASFNAREIFPETLALIWTPPQVLIPWFLALICLLVKLPQLWTFRKVIVTCGGSLSLIAALVYKQALLTYPLLTCIALILQVMFIALSQRLIDEKQK